MPTGVDDLGVGTAVVPEAVATLQMDHRIAVHLDGSGGSEGNPAERLPAAPVGPPAMQVAAADELLADSLDGVAVQSQHGAAAGGEPDHVEAAGPPLVVSAGRLMDLAAIVPDAVDRPGESVEVLAGGRVLDPVAVGQYHASAVI